MSERPIYSPVPARAMGDASISGADLRVLMAIASHDRFGKNGTGCYASHATLAVKVSLNSKSVARSIGKLRDAGYISVEKNPLNGRLAVYRVIYTEEDAAVMRGDGRPGVRPTRPKSVSTGNEDATNRSEGGAAIGNKAATDNKGATGNNPATDYPLIGNSVFQESEQDQRVDHVNIFPERDNRLGEALARQGGASGVAGLLSDAREVAKRALSGELLKGEAQSRLSRIRGRVRAWAQDDAEREVERIIGTVEADAPLDPTPREAWRARIPAPIERKALADAEASGAPPPSWVRASVRGAA